MNETIEDIVREMRELAHDRMTDDGAYHKSVSVGSKLDNYADRIEAAAKRRTMQCHSADSCDLLFQANFEADKLNTENAKLKAALKPVLDIVMDDATSDLAMADAIDEAHRIYKEGAIK